MRLTGKVALISGGARGMGAAEARLFAREGAQVVIADIVDAEGHEVEADIKAKGGEAFFAHSMSPVNPTGRRRSAWPRIASAS
jgi:NAD(P)-dependent dehydrogenase (short-subunit alcohol dehydrogenase family)